MFCLTTGARTLVSILILSSASYLRIQNINFISSKSSSIFSFKTSVTKWRKQRLLNRCPIKSLSSIRSYFYLISSWCLSACFPVVIYILFYLINLQYFESILFSLIVRYKTKFQNYWLNSSVLHHVKIYGLKVINLCLPYFL